MYPDSIKENRRMWTCNRLDLQTLGSRPVIMPKNLQDHWPYPSSKHIKRRETASSELFHLAAAGYEVAMSLERHVSVAKLDCQALFHLELQPSSTVLAQIFAVFHQPPTSEKISQRFSSFWMPGCRKMHLKSIVDSTTTDGIRTFKSRILKR